jgi:hypothetical protein
MLLFAMNTNHKWFVRLDYLIDCRKFCYRAPVCPYGKVSIMRPDLNHLAKYQTNPTPFRKICQQVLRELLGGKVDGLVKSPSAALRCNFVVAAHL